MKHVDTKIGYSTEKYLIYIDGIRLSGDGYGSLEEAEGHLPKKSGKHIYQIIREKTDTLIFNYKNGAK